MREAFKDLLKGWARSHDLVFVPEYEYETATRDRRYVDGPLRYSLRVPFGYWEAKDQKDDLYAEIEIKRRRGHPRDNIIFEDSREAVLIQNRQEVVRCPVNDTSGLEKLLKVFFGYQRPEIADSRKAVEHFKTDLPAILTALREIIEAAERDNAGFREAGERFLAHAKDVINPSLTDADVRGMLIQHVLTEKLFTAVFPGTEYHKDNNIARELFKLESTFFTGNTKHQTLRGLAPYYAAVRTAAARITSHHEKQSFLKARARKVGVAPKAMLKADKDPGRILLDSETTLIGVPREAWDYKLGNRCALEWVLDQYKEKAPRDPTTREKFNTYRFADYKEKIVDLLRRVTTVSVETQRIVEAMKVAAR